MKRKTFPKGTKESLSKGFMSKNGTKHFVHVVNTNEFYRSYPAWRSKNPRTNHVYEFEGRLVTGNQIMTFLKQNMKQTTPRRSPRNLSGRTASTATGSGSPFRRVTRSMTRTASRTSPASASSTRTKRSRKQAKPVRSYFE